MFSRLLYGRHRFLFENGFPLTARLAWGRTLTGDPSLAEWLSDDMRFEAYHNGAVLFAPKLLQLAAAAKIPHRGKLRGIMRWRLASNNYAASSIATAVAALTSASQRVSVAGGWSDLELGRLPMEAAHLDCFIVAVNPFRRRDVEEALRPLGWNEVGDAWVRKLRKGKRGAKVVKMKVGPSLMQSASSRFECDVFPQQVGLHHVDGHPLALALAQHALDFANVNEKGQFLDRLVDLLPDQRRADSLVDYARSFGSQQKVERALALIDCLCGSPGAALLGRIGWRSS